MVNDGKSWEIHHTWMLLGWNLWRLELFHQGVCNSWTTLFPPMQWQRVPYTMRFRRGSVSEVLNQNHLEDLFTFDSNLRGSFGYGTDIVQKRCIYGLHIWIYFRYVYTVQKIYLFNTHIIFGVQTIFQVCWFLPVFAQWTWGKTKYGRSLGMTTEHLKGCSSGLFQMSRQYHMRPCLIEIADTFVQDPKHWFVKDRCSYGNKRDTLSQKLPIRYRQWGCYKAITKHPRHHHCWFTVAYQLLVKRNDTKPPIWATFCRPSGSN